MRYLVSTSKEVPATPWVVVNPCNNEILRRFATEVDAIKYADDLNRWRVMDERAAHDD